jgi:hypothetical protein
MREIQGAFNLYKDVKTSKAKRMSEQMGRSGKRQILKQNFRIMRSSGNNQQGTFLLPCFALTIRGIWGGSRKCGGFFVREAFRISKQLPAEQPRRFEPYTHFQEVNFAFFTVKQTKEHLKQINPSLSLLSERESRVMVYFQGT